MAKAKPKRSAPKSDPRVAAVRAAMAEHESEIDQLWAMDQAFGEGNRATIAGELAAEAKGLPAAWLHVLAGTATAEHDRAIGELCARATSGRALLTRILTTIEARLD